MTTTREAPGASGHCGRMSGRGGSTGSSPGCSATSPRSTRVSACLARRRPSRRRRSRWPTGFQGLAHPEGEVATARGAARAGALMVLSTRSSMRIEKVAEAVASEGGTWWFQVYVMRDRALTAGLAERAVAAWASALVLTGDTPVGGRKRRERTEGVISDAQVLANIGPLADLSQAGQATGVTFADIGWLARLGVPVLVKGVLRP